jgi:hypothetical protein
VEKSGNHSRNSSAPAALTACSACAGDYEDPDRTAWAEIQNEQDDASEDEDAAVEQRNVNQSGALRTRVEFRSALRQFNGS